MPSRVVLVPTGQAFDCQPGEPILSAALRAGLNLPHSCKGGHCASCRARLVAGSVEYERSLLPAGITAQEAQEGYVLLCQARATSPMVRVEAREMRPAPEVEVRSLPCRIERIERLADDVRAVFLRLPAVETFHFRAGQYLDFMLAGGRRRSFSIASAPADGRLLEVHARRASTTGFTAQLFDTMGPGTLLRIEGPLGQFWFRNESPRAALMIGGGTGYAPLRAMLRQLVATGDRRPVTLYWGGRAPADLYEHDWLGGLAAGRPGFRYRPVLSGGAEVPDDWPGRRGLVHEAVLRDLAADGGLATFDVYASGPPAMVEAIRGTFVAAGLPREQLFFDSFDYAPDTLAAMRGA
jgi:CDP-4-dehydro-6-deoxyglucose reductase